MELAARIFSDWAQDNAPWSAWVKPALFTSIKGINAEERVVFDDIASGEDWLRFAVRGCAVIIDMPGEESVRDGILLVKRNYQPVPLFNCCNASGAVVDVSSLIDALIQGAKYLSSNKVKEAALPAFLLDHNRLPDKPNLSPGKYDNRWCVVPQDMPSAAKLVESGISSVLVRTPVVRKDLGYILKKYQEGGLKIDILHPGFYDAVPFRSSSYSWVRKFWHRMLVLWGLRRSFSGGFGSLIPDSGGYHGGVG